MIWKPVKQLEPATSRHQAPLVTLVLTSASPLKLVCMLELSPSHPPSKAKAR